MVDWLGGALGWLGGVLVGFAAGLVASFLEPVKRLTERWGRRVLDPKPLDVNVETDLGLIWAGDPDWIGASFWVPYADDLGAPPSTLAAWQKWVQSRGGHDRGTSTVRLTLVARASVTVVVGMPLVEATREPAPAGLNLVRPVGGAEIHPLGIDVHLVDGAQSWAGVSSQDGPERRGALSWSMRPGEVEQFLLRVTPEAGGLWRWRVNLPLIVDGESRLHPVTNDGKDFVVVGREPGEAEEMWTENVWWSRPSPDV